MRCARSKVSRTLLSSSSHSFRLLSSTSFFSAAWRRYFTVRASTVSAAVSASNGVERRGAAAAVTVGLRAQRSTLHPGCETRPRQAPLRPSAARVGATRAQPSLSPPHRGGHHAINIQGHHQQEFLKKLLKKSNLKPKWLRRWWWCVCRSCVWCGVCGVRGVCGDVRVWAHFVWAHFVRCCVAVTSHPQPPLRGGHGCTVGVNRDPPV